MKFKNIIIIFVLIIFGCKKDEFAVEKPTLTTLDVLNISKYGASTGGEIQSDGGADIIDKGICWSTYPNPLISNNYISYGSGLGSFPSELNNLESNTNYYVRAYATNSKGTSYGNEMTFKTLSQANITTSSITGISEYAATCGGEINAEGIRPNIVYGVCWDKYSDPSIYNDKTTDGTSVNDYLSFTSYITNLTSNTRYHVRAYATEDNETQYGENQNFTTLAEVSTNTVSGITSSTATCGGYISYGGGEAIYERGVCWNTYSNPTIFDSRTSDGTGTGSYTSNITGLANNTTYYIRAYATNEGGTVYGEEYTFVTATSYCTSNHNTNDEWIDYVSFSGISYSSAGSSTGYVYVISQYATVTKGYNYTLIFSSGFRSGYSATEYWCVWIDYNHNGVFGSSEKALQSMTSNTANYSNNIIIPSTATSGWTRMRVSMKFNSLQTDACDAFTYGEVEDYDVYIY